MKERPIIFSGDMVRAILDGAKTQTRRVARGYQGDVDEMGRPIVNPRGCVWRTLRCPYGEAGDRLWVKESWATMISGRAEPHRVGYRPRGATIYMADYYRGVSPPVDHPAWRPSLFMTRERARITLDVLTVRLERLQDISDDDARAEGVEADFGNAHSSAANDYRRSFARLWDSINGKRGGAAWTDNPWVWRVEFGRVA